MANFARTRLPLPYGPLFAGLLALSVGPNAVLAQDEGAGDKQVVESVEELAASAEQLLQDEILGACPSGCCPSSGDKVVMGVASGVTFLILFFLMVRLVERVFIRRESSPLLGRHLGISMALFLGGCGMIAIFFLIAGCWHPSYLLWGAFVGTAWLLHLLYTIFAVRRD